MYKLPHGASSAREAPYSRSGLVPSRHRAVRGACTFMSPRALLSMDRAVSRLRFGACRRTFLLAVELGHSERLEGILDHVGCLRTHRARFDGSCHTRDRSPRSRAVLSVRSIWRKAASPDRRL